MNLIVYLREIGETCKTILHQKFEVKVAKKENYPGLKNDSYSVNSDIIIHYWD